MQFFTELEGYFTSRLDAIKSLLSMTKLEMRLAKLSLFPLVMNVGMILAVLMVIWLTSMVMLGYGVYVAYPHLMLALSSVLFVNLLFLYGLKRYFSFNIKNLSFEQTRKYAGLISIRGTDGANEQKTRCDDGDIGSGNEITDPDMPNKQT